MAIRDVLGVYRDLDSTVAAVDRLAEQGIHRADFEVLSNAPFPEGTFGHDESTTRLGVFPLVGAACGFAVGLLLTGGTQIAYPLVTGGKPLFSIPPMVIIMYEGTMLAAVIFTVIGTLFESRLPRLHRAVYDTRITEGYIGLLVHAPEEKVGAAADAMLDAGALDVHIETTDGGVETRNGASAPRRGGAEA